MILKVSDLKPNPKNPRTIKDSKLIQLKKSLETYGSLDGFVFNKRTGHLISGHQRSKILKDGKIKGYFVYWEGKRFPYREVDWSIAKEKAATIAANHNAGDWDFDQLGEWMNDLKDFDLDLTMFDEDERAEFFTDEKKGLIEDDEVPEARKTSIKSGDLFSLGEHRLMCGDSTHSKTVASLMNGEKADMVFTDPPYGIDLKPTNIGGLGKNKHQKIENDSDTSVWKKAFSIWFSEKMIIWGGNYFTDIHPVNGKWIVWNKMKFDKPEQTFSACELAWTNLKGVAVEMYSHVWDGAFREGTKAVEGQTRMHPAQKPVGLIEKIIDGKIIADPFLGSGSTLIACEKTNRKCYGMEIDPQYCQVIIDRWEKFTGKKAKKVG